MNVYAYVIGIVLLVAVGWWLDHNGYERAIANQVLMEKEQLAADAKTVDEIKGKGKEREKVVIKWKTKIVEKGQCFDKPLPDSHINKLRDAYNEITRP